MPLTYGGTFAPPYTDELLAKYKALAEGYTANPEIQEAILTLHKCVAQWWELPESNGTTIKHHPSGRGLIVPLEKQHADALYDAIPWEKELAAYSQLFDRLDPVSQKELRNLAFHLLWGVRELNLDREPMTTDKL